MLNGLLLVDKPAGCTSHDVVARVRKILNMTAVGHSGTLDPFASGLMVILLGHATKLSDYVLNQNKRYRVQIRLGRVTDTGDRTGETLSEQNPAPDAAAAIGMLREFQGEMDLAVPKFSAVKVKGKKLYEYARAGEVMISPVKHMKFFDLEVIEVKESLMGAEVSCEKGGYIRAWVPAFGEKFGTGATVEELRRVRSEPYAVEQAITLEDLESQVKKMESGVDLVGHPPCWFVPLIEALPHFVQCSVRGREEIMLKNGQIAHDLINRLILTQKRANQERRAVGVKVVGSQGHLIGILEALPAQGIKIRRIFADQGS